MSCQLDKNLKRRRKPVTAATDLSEFLDRHKGKKCFVTGAGPSLGLMDLTDVHQHPVIAVNSSILMLPWEEPGDPWMRFWVSTDMLCMQWSYFWKKVIKVDCTRMVRNSWIRSMDKCKGVKFHYYSPRRTNTVPKKRGEGLYGGSSILSAVDLGLVMGCKEIYLLGVDHRMLHGKSHFWQSWPKSERPIREGKGGDYFPCQRQQSRVFKSNFNTFKVMSQYAKSLGAEIYNCSTISKVESFPFKSLNEALA
jgi:hypothetical protein